jgi:hypothetical protein
MKTTSATILAAVLLATATNVHAYTKPVTYKYDGDQIVFADWYMKSPHSWMIVKAIDLLRRDGFIKEAAEAQHHLLPMLEGVTFNDVWGDADLAGASVLDYYVPYNDEEDYGFGSAFASYAHSTQEYHGHPFYRFGNSAEYAQYHYGFAVRIMHGFWGTDARDRMGGWVIDNDFGQDDPIDGKYASDAAELDAVTQFGAGQTPASALTDLLTYHTNSYLLFPEEHEDASRRIYVPKSEVFDVAPEWFQNRFGGDDTEDIEAYMGYDGHGFAWYANWTLDAGGAFPNCSGCFWSFVTGGSDGCYAAPMVVRLPVGSTAHAFFQLGWAIHLLEDATTPVHTISSSFQTYEVHNDIEKRADEVLSDNIAWNGHVVKDTLPADNAVDFHNTYAFPPGSLSDNSCLDFARNPLADFAPRDYVGTLERMDGEDYAHAYVRRNAELSHQHYRFISCINTEDDTTWDKVGFFTAYGLDLGIKSVAGLMHQFMSDAGLDDREPPSVTLQSLYPSPTNHNAFLLNGTATDAGSNLASVEISLDDGGTWRPALASDGAFDGVEEFFALATGLVPDGTYAIRARATDASGNVTPPSSQPRIVILVDTTPPTIAITQPQPIAYVHSATLVLAYAADDGAGSGVKTRIATMDGSPTLAGHGLAPLQPINLLTELSLGPHTFAVDATDFATNGSRKTVVFTIIVTAESIKADVAAFVSSGAINQSNWATSLLDKLGTAATYRARGDCPRANAAYQDFINEVTAQTGKKVAPFAAAILIADARYLISHCP